MLNMNDQEVELNGEMLNDNPVKKNSKQVKHHHDIQLKGIDDVKISSLTIHGLPRAIESTSWIARIFWLVLFLIGFGFFVNLANTAFKHYLENETYQKVTLKVLKKVSFPSVTICNMKSINANTNKRHKTNSSHKSPSDGLAHYLRNHRKVYHHPHIEAFSPGYSKFLKGDDSKTCHFGSRFQKCDIKKMFKTVALVDGCLTFNPDGNLYQTQHGKNYGLQMLLYVNSSIGASLKTDEYFTGNEQEDIVVIIHEPGSYPDLSYRPIFLESGIHTKIAIRKRVSTRLRDPAPSKCVSQIDGTNFNLFPGKYMPSLCADSCHLHKAYFECGDVPDWFRVIFGSKSLPRINMTTIDQKACLKKHANDYLSRTDETNCVCPPACQSVHFENMITTAQWPARNSKTKAIKYLSGVMNKKVVDDELTKDFAYLSVFFDDFVVNQEDEIRKYDTFSLLSDLGGQAGLYLGASFFSIIELALVLFFYILGKIKKLMTKK